MKKGVHKNFEKFNEKHLPAKKDSGTGVLFWIWEIFTEHLRAIVPLQFTGNILVMIISHQLLPDNFLIVIRMLVKFVIIILIMTFLPQICELIT